MGDTKLTGIVIMPNNISYKQSAKNYNLEIKNYPGIIVFCLNEDDVKNALMYAKENKINFRIRVGRHDFEANSNINYGLVIDLSKINFIDVDRTNEVVNVGGGVLLKDLYMELIKYGYTIPAGTCGDVGIVGLCTVGGLGYASRYLGLTIDSLLEARVIDSSINRLIVDKNNNSDLFWALKGSPASQFCVVTSMKLKIHKVNRVTIFESSWYEKDFIEIIDIFQKISYSLDNRLTLNLKIIKLADDSLKLNLSGQFFGIKHKLLDLLKPFFNVANPKEFTISYIKYVDAINNWNKYCVSNIKFKNSGSFVYKNIPLDELKVIVQLIKYSPKNTSQSLEFIQLGGSVKSYSHRLSSFAHRRALYLVEVKSSWIDFKDRIESKEWTKLCKRFLDTVGNGNYRGFTDFDVTNWQHQYYRNNYYELRMVKNRYDKLNFFSYFQGIHTSKYNISGLTGKVITKESKEYDDSKNIYNIRFDYHPSIIVYANNEEDVKNAITWAKNNFISITVRCGGYSYEGFCESDESLLLDVSNLLNISIDKEHNLVTIGSGYRVGELYTKLFEEGYQFTGGNCFGVGISGLVAGGGIGLSSRLYGLCCDNLIELKLINSEGKVIVASDKLNSNLFWACRGGGGGNFGVFTEFTFKINPLKKLTYIKISFDKKDRFKAIKKYQQFSINVDKRVTMQMSITETKCIIEGFSYTDLDETKDIVRPILEVGDCKKEFEENITFIEGIRKTEYSNLKSSYFKNSGAYVYEVMTDVAICKLLDDIDAAPQRGSHMVVVRTLGGAISENKVLNTSYAYREAFYLIEYISRWNNYEDSDANIDWTRKIRRDMSEYAYNTYVNFTDKDIINYLKSYYGDNIKKLLYVKNKYNKNNIFRCPHSL